jgi:hypothetical protein
MLPKKLGQNKEKQIKDSKITRRNRISTVKRRISKSPFILACYLVG